MAVHFVWIENQQFRSPEQGKKCQRTKKKLQFMMKDPISKVISKWQQKPGQVQKSLDYTFLDLRNHSLKLRCTFTGDYGALKEKTKK